MTDETADGRPRHDTTETRRELPLAAAARRLVSLLLPGWKGWLLILIPAALTTLAALSARQVIEQALASHEVLASK